jgi:hypothetical protein
MTILNPQSRQLIRQPIEIGDQWVDPIPREDIGVIKSILSRDGDVDIIKNSMISRFAYVIGKEKDVETGGTVVNFKRVRNAAMATAIDTGMYEVSRMYLIDRVSEQGARLFSEPANRYEYEGGSEQLEQQMLDIRNRGFANQKEQSADLYAVGCGSSLEYLSMEGDNISYDDIVIDGFYYGFADYITDDGNKRPTNKENIDEATVVVLRLEGGSSDNARFAAWFGESTAYPQGRYVVYEAREWHKFPSVGDESALDYYWKSATDFGFKERALIDEVANPLTWHRQQTGDDNVPEYPFVVYRGDPRGRGLLPSTGVSLAKISEEFDISSSIIIRAANDGAVGQKVFSQGEGGESTIPLSLMDHVVMLNRGQTLSNQGWNASNARDAMEVLLNQVRNVAEAHNVPGFLINTDYSTFPSGAALRQAMSVQSGYRDKRIAMNRASVDRRWQLERALINMSEGSLAVRSDVKQSWKPGPMAFPEDPLEVINVFKEKLDKGAADIFDFVRAVESLETREQAENYLDERKQAEERVAELQLTKAAPAPTPGAAIGGGLAARFGATPGVRT